METLLKLLEERPPTIMVVGDVMCDNYIFGKVCRISPEAPVPVFERVERCRTLGGAANVAANLRALGCDVRLIGAIGADSAGSHVRALLNRQGISDRWLTEDSTRPTTEKTRLVAQQQHILRLDKESRTPLSQSISSKVREDVDTSLAECDGVVCSDYDKGVCTSDVLQPLFEKARSLSRPVIVDPKKENFEHYRGATVLTPNLAELERSSGLAVNSEADLEKAASLLLRRTEAKALLVTRGKDGMSLFRQSCIPVHIRTQARAVFDVTGAGDTAIAGFSMAMTSGATVTEAMQIANVAAGIVVGKIGTAVVSLEELRTTFRANGIPQSRKILNRSDLALAVQYHRQRGERIVFTNGCFDLLHVGHVQHLEEAAALGDQLIVGLNSDRSVSAIKGIGRPVIGEGSRAQLLASLACVNYVTIFDEASPLPLIQLLRPEVLVKGGDYTIESVVGRAEVERYGGCVRILPFRTASSTTGVIETIRERLCGSNRVDDNSDSIR